MCMIDGKCTSLSSASSADSATGPAVASPSSPMNLTPSLTRASKAEGAKRARPAILTASRVTPCDGGCDTAESCTHRSVDVESSNPNPRLVCLNGST